jgi:hypothetical protein
MMMMMMTGMICWEKEIDERWCKSICDISAPGS